MKSYKFYEPRFNNAAAMMGESISPHRFKNQFFSRKNSKDKNLSSVPSREAFQLPKIDSNKGNINSVSAA